MQILATIAGLIALSAVHAQTCSGTYGGTCQSTSTCTTGTISGLCPGDSTIKCCLPACDGGKCIDTSTQACSGNVASGMCPGPTNIKCCLPNCTGGKCINSTTQSCSGTLASGLCPGSSAIKCCQTSSSSTGPCSYPCAKQAAANWSLSNNGVNLVAHFEGFSSTCYKDTAGVYTIGIGHACQSSADQLPQYGLTCTSGSCSGSLTYSEAQTVFKSDAASFITCVRNAVKVSITQNQFDALVSFSFNVGCGAFQSSTLLSKLNAGTLTDKAAQYEFTRWHSSCTEGLKRRRFMESQLFSSCSAPGAFPCTTSGCSNSYNYKGCASNCQYCTACSGCSGDAYTKATCSVTPY